MAKRGRPQKQITNEMIVDVQNISTDKFMERYNVGKDILIRTMHAALTRRKQSDCIKIEYGRPMAYVSIFNRYGIIQYKNKLSIELQKLNNMTLDCLHAVEMNHKADVAIDIIPKLRKARRIVKDSLEYIERNYDLLSELKDNTKKFKTELNNRRYITRVMKRELGGWFK